MTEWKVPDGAEEQATCRMAPHTIYRIGSVWADATGSPHCHGTITHSPMPDGFTGEPQAISGRGGNRR